MADASISQDRKTINIQKKGSPDRNGSKIKPAVTFPFVLTQAEGHHIYATCLLHYVEQTYDVTEDDNGLDLGDVGTIEMEKNVTLSQ